MIAGASITDERKESGWNFSDGYYYATQSMAARTDSEISGFADLEGKIMGLIDMNHRIKDMPNMICGVGITELRGLITKLSNSRQKAYLGIHGSTITEEISKAQELPVGLYVTEVDMDSPAMAAGLASGDILIQAGETPVTSYRDLINVLMVSEPEDTVRLKLRRSNNGSWNEMQVTVTLAVFKKEN